MQSEPPVMGYTKKNVELLHDKSQTKVTAFTREEREALKLRGLLPYIVSTQEIQVKRTMEICRQKESNIERYIFLSSLQERNERLFYRTVIEHIDEVMT